MFKDILTRVAEDTGYHVTQDRTLLTKLIHRAAEMIYNRLECNAIMREATVLVPENMVISLPSFIGPLRGIKESSIERNFKVNPMMYPRYVKDDWTYKWKNWRELRVSPIHTNLGAVGPLTLTVAAVESTPVTVKIVGQTDTAARIEEEVVMSATSMSTTNSFGPNVYSIVCFDTRTKDITIKDDTNTEVAILYNNEQKTHYKLYDVSEYQWSKDVSDGTTTIEILYKHPLFQMINDADEFPAQGYENAIYFEAMALWAAPQQGKEQLAAAWHQQAMIEPITTKDNEESMLNKKLNFGRNPVYGATRRYYHNSSPFNRRYRRF